MNSKLREEQRVLRKEANAKEHENKLLGNALKAAQAQLQELKSAAGLEAAGALQEIGRASCRERVSTSV